MQLLHCLRNSTLVVSSLVALSIVFQGCKESMNHLTDRVFETAKTQMVQMDSRLSETLMPRTIDKDDNFVPSNLQWWCSGFYPGSLWFVWKYTGDEQVKSLAEKNTLKLDAIKGVARDHDLGFQINCSFGNALRLTGDDRWSEPVVTAANALAKRFNPNVGLIKSWNTKGPQGDWLFPVIIDNMMNLELLFEASKITGDQRYYDIAVNHANTTMGHHFRPDNSCYHVVDYNPTDGSVIKRITHQGLFDESVWSRGQGWALYGFTMCYRYTHDKAYLEQAQKIANFWFSQPNMPDDLIPYWDMRDPAIKTGVGPAQDGTCPRDASAAAIIASALYELATYVGAEDAATYQRYADMMVHSLETKYVSEPQSAQGFLLLHSTGNYPGNDEIDVPINYADYYYLEALLRREAMRE